MIVDKVAACIVLYNPNLERLRQNVEAIALQIDMVFCFDNGSENAGAVKSLLATYENVYLIEAGENLGISVALNRVARMAADKDCPWLLSLDQDSVCPDGMVSALLAYGGMEQVGAICPVFVDSRRPKESLPTDAWSEIEDCITSGMLMNLAVYKEINGMDEHLFVGYVDDEYCYRLRLCGYRIIQVNSVILDHELGELKPSRAKDFWLTAGSLLHSKKIKALSYKRKVSPIRVYYGARNAVYLEKKYRDYPSPMFSKRAAIKSGVLNVLRAQDKVAVAKALRNGLRDGGMYEVEAWGK